MCMAYFRDSVEHLPNYYQLLVDVDIIIDLLALCLTYTELKEVSEIRPCDYVCSNQCLNVSTATPTLPYPASPHV